MAATVEELEKRVLFLEEEVERLRCLLALFRVNETPTEQADRMLWESNNSQAAINAAVAQAYAEMGITGEPVGIEKLREMMRASGMDPKDNSFSREITAMREE